MTSKLPRIIRWWIVDDATTIVRGLKETLAQKNTIIILKNIMIKRLQREIKDKRIIK
jgi:hypothetical protein